MVIKKIDGEFSISKLENFSKVNFDEEYCFACKTDEEYSLVCKASRAPINAIKCDKGWRMLRIEGELDFSLIGILAKISSILAEAKIGIFAVSTYNTDYILVKENDFKNAILALQRADYEII